MKRWLSVMAVLSAVYSPFSWAKLGKALRIDAAGANSCAIFETSPGSSDTTVRCWGSKKATGTGDDSCWACNEDVLKVPKLNHPREIKVTMSHACAIHDGGVKCWGSDGDHLAAPPIINPVSLALGTNMSCAIDNTSNLSCWGKGIFGKLCGPSPKGDCLPFIPIKAKFVMINQQQLCIAGETGDTLICWRTDIGYIYDYNEYSKEKLPKGKIKALAAGEIEDALVLTDSQVNLFRTGGFHDLSSYNFPEEEKVTDIATGGYHHCVIRSGRVLCLAGYNGWVAGTMDPPEEITHATQIASGWNHNCVIQDGKVICWGLDNLNQLNVPTD